MKVLEYAVIGGMVAIAVASLLLIAGLVVMLAWNIGVTAVVAACGGAVSKIGFGSAVFTNIALGIIQRTLRAPAPAIQK